MAKNFVLDTNVLIHDPEAIFKFDEHDLYIPIFVIEEIDKFKMEGTERGRNCRHFCRLIDGLATSSGGRLDKGVPLGDKKGKLVIHVPKNHDHSRGLEHGAQDRAILNSAIEIRDNEKRKKTFFVTMDTNLRIRAGSMGMESETYENC